MSGDTPSLENASVAALLVQRSRDDQNELVDELAAMLAEVVPGMRVERALLRRHITSIRIPVGAFVYILTRGANGAFDAMRHQEVRGVVVRTVPLELGAFVEELGLALDVELRRTEKGRQALQTWVSSTSS